MFLTRGSRNELPPRLRAVMSPPPHHDRAFARFLCASRFHPPELLCLAEETLARPDLSEGERKECRRHDVGFYARLCPPHIHRRDRRRRSLDALRSWNPTPRHGEACTARGMLTRLGGGHLRAAEAQPARLTVVEDRVAIAGFWVRARGALGRFLLLCKSPEERLEEARVRHQRNATFRTGLQHVQGLLHPRGHLALVLGPRPRDRRAAVLSFARVCAADAQVPCVPGWTRLVIGVHEWLASRKQKPECAPRFVSRVNPTLDMCRSSCDSTAHIDRHVDRIHFVKYRLHHQNLVKAAVILFALNRRFSVALSGLQLKTPCRCSI
mmetsp:Transcript_67387/g.179957  ORF Transcript_67387/g.179957 Transcript_67387/m.179957 type:complete len:324 (-) Transcript_67387:848-1819(-)